MKANVYLATINVPGYLPMADEPAVFRTPAEAWAWLAQEREHGEQDTSGDVWGNGTFGSPTWHALFALGDPSDVPANMLSEWDVLPILSAGSLGTVHGPTPGADSEHDLGLSYTVSLVKHADYPHSPGYLPDCPACDLACHCTEDVAKGHDAQCVFDGEHDYSEPPYGPEMPCGCRPHMDAGPLGHIAACRQCADFAGAGK